MVINVADLRKVVNTTASSYQHEKEPTLAERSNGSRYNNHTYVWQWQDPHPLPGNLLEIVAMTSEEPEFTCDGMTSVIVPNTGYDVFLDNVNVTPPITHGGAATEIIIPNGDGRTVHKLGDSLPF